MNRSAKHEPTQTDTPKRTPQTRRYDATFKRRAVENWIKTGTQIAEELSISYPSLKEWKQRC